MINSGLARTCFDEGFLPENLIRIPVNSVIANQMTQDRFDKILDAIEDLYAPVAAQKGGKLLVQHDWDDPTVNAFAERQGNTWIIRMLGGLARHPSVTEDGFALVACHEVGHHVGGLPRYRDMWAANEGQADYFATLKCLRKVFSRHPPSAIGELQPDHVVKQCKASFNQASEVSLCIRESMAGYSAALLSLQIGGSTGEINFETPDPARAKETYDYHPGAQCRLDTYFEGSLCSMPDTTDLSENDPLAGTCTADQGYRRGWRPGCWYRAEGASTPPPSGIARNPSIGGQTDVWIYNPYLMIAVDYDVSEFTTAAGAYLEFSRPDSGFQIPNGTTPDPFRSAWAVQPATRGRFFLTPSQHLPGWGVYAFRIIALDATGQYPVGRFSSASTLRISP